MHVAPIPLKRQLVAGPASLRRQAWDCNLTLPDNPKSNVAGTNGPQCAVPGSLFQSKDEPEGSEGVAKPGFVLSGFEFNSA
jgi:hypothetical protein